eukprot:scaffold11778_cov49-Phaeocystis_antarctica.AAC.1
MWPVRRWRRSTAVPKEPFPSVLTVSYSPKVPLASCAALGAASFHTSRKPRLGNVRVRLPLRRCRGEPITAIPGGVVGTPSCAAESLLDCWGVASGIGWNSLFRPKSECRLNSGGGSGGSGGGSCLPQLGDDAGDGLLPPVGKVVDGLTSRDCTPSTSSIASDSQSIASAREIDALVGGRGELSRDAGGPRCPVGSGELWRPGNHPNCGDPWGLCRWSVLAKRRSAGCDDGRSGGVSSRPSAMTSRAKVRDVVAAAMSSCTVAAGAVATGGLARALTGAAPRGRYRLLSACEPCLTAVLPLPVRALDVA